MSKADKLTIPPEIDEVAFLETFFPPGRATLPEHNLLIYAITDAFKLAFCEGNEAELWWILCGDNRPHSLQWMLSLLEIDYHDFMEACREHDWRVDYEQLRYRRERIMW